MGKRLGWGTSRKNNPRQYQTTCIEPVTRQQTMTRKITTKPVTGVFHFQYTDKVLLLIRDNAHTSTTGSR